MKIEEGMLVRNFERGNSPAHYLEVGFKTYCGKVMDNRKLMECSSGFPEEKICPTCLQIKKLEDM